MPENQRRASQNQAGAPANFAVKIRLDSASSTPLYKQLARQLTEAIESLSLMPGQVMPSTRELADYLQISRKTVVRSYEELISQGFLFTTRGIGTLVKQPTEKHSRSDNQDQTPPLELSAFARRLLQFPEAELSCSAFPELNHGAPPADLVPIKQWRQIMLKYSREHEVQIKSFEIEPFGQRQLRSAVCAYLKRQRAMTCDLEQVITYVDSTTPTRFASQLIIDPGDLVAVENPGYPFARRCFQILGAEILPIPVDEQGMQVEKLIETSRKVKAVYVTPSHQDPHGGTLPLTRRKQLLDWASASGAIIFEDDYENEFFYGASNLPPLYSLDKDGRVIYLSSFYKTLFPLTDAGIVVIPLRLTKAFARAQEMYSGVSSCLSMQEQVGITTILDEGILERHIRKTRSVYEKRRQTLIAALTKSLKGMAELTKITGAMTLILRFDKTIAQSVILECAREAQFPLVGTDDYYMSAPPGHEFLTSFAILEESKIQARVDCFAQLIKNALDRS